MDTDMSTPDRTQTIHVALPKAVVVALDRAAGALGLKRSAYVRMLLLQAMKETQT